MAALPDAEAKPAGLPLALLQRGLAVLTVDHFSTGDPPDQFANFYTTYNRTKLQERVRDLLTVCAAAGSVADPRGPRFFKVTFWAPVVPASGRLLAAPGAGAVIADCDQLDVTSDQALLAPDLFCPGIRNIGTFEGGAMLAAPHPLLLHNTGAGFPDRRAAFGLPGSWARATNCAWWPPALPDEELVRWVLQAKSVRFASSRRRERAASASERFRGITEARGRGKNGRAVGQVCALQIRAR